MSEETNNQRELKEKGIPVTDWNDSKLVTGATVKVDPTQDAWEQSAPPPKGEYDLRLHLGKNGFTMDKLDENKPFDDNNVVYKCELECKIVSDDPLINGFTVFGNVSTRRGRAKDISTMEGLMVKCGFTKMPNEMAPKQAAMYLDKIIKQREPVLKGCKLDWQGWSKKTESVIFWSMEDFPKNKDGTYNHLPIVTLHNRQSEEIPARIKIKEWGSVTGTTASTAKTMPQPVAVTPVVEQPKKAKANAKPVAPPAMDEQLSIDDLMN